MTAPTCVIEFWGGPGCGKSTLAAGLYAEMKARGKSVELVREYVKPWAWRGHAIKRWDEVYIFAKQLRAEADLYGKVDYLITDRPLGLSAVYERMYRPESIIMRNLVRAVELEQCGAAASGAPRAVGHVALLVERDERAHPYATDGRFETAAMAHDVDAHCKIWLDTEVIPYRIVRAGMGVRGVAAAAGLW